MVVSSSELYAFFGLISLVLHLQSFERIKGTCVSTYLEVNTTIVTKREDNFLRQRWPLTQKFSGHMR